MPFLGRKKKKVSRPQPINLRINNTQQIKREIMKIAETRGLLPIKTTHVNNRRLTLLGQESNVNFNTFRAEPSPPTRRTPTLNKYRTRSGVKGYSVSRRHRGPPPPPPSLPPIRRTRISGSKNNRSSGSKNKRSSGSKKKRSSGSKKKRSSGTKKIPPQPPKRRLSQSIAQSRRGRN